MIYDTAGDFFASFLRDAAISEHKWKLKHPNLPTREFVTLNHKIYGWHKKTSIDHAISIVSSLVSWVVSTRSRTDAAFLKYRSNKKSLNTWYVLSRTLHTAMTLNVSSRITSLTRTWANGPSWTFAFATTLQRVSEKSCHDSTVYEPKLNFFHIHSPFRNSVSWNSIIFSNFFELWHASRRVFFLPDNF